MSTVNMSDALAEWMQAQGATEIRMAFDDDADGAHKWSAAIVRGHGLAQYIEILDTSAEYRTCWEPLVELARDCMPVEALPCVDWGRLA